VLSVVATQVKTVQDCIKKLAIVANREPQFQHLPPGLPPVTLGYFMFEGDMVSRCNLPSSSLLPLLYRLYRL
jgi:dynein heavy chain